MYRIDGIIEMIGRIMIAFLFIYKGISAIGRFEFYSRRLRQRKVPAPDFVLVCGLAMLP